MGQAAVLGKKDLALEEPTLGHLLSRGIRALRVLGPVEARVNAEWLLSETTGLERSALYRDDKLRIPHSTARQYASLIEKRRARTPLAYLTGKAYFWDLVLEIGPGCLIPRPETEILVERFIAHSGFGKEDPFSFLDLGSGSGAIGIALLRHYLNARATFSDRFLPALEFTRKNLELYKLLDRAEAVESDLFEHLAPGKWQAILSNPPYLSDQDWPEVEPEILCEPKSALDGGQSGLDFYFRIIRQAFQFLEPGGLLMLEIGKGQAGAVTSLLREKGYEQPQCFNDHAGIPRVVLAAKN